MNNIYLCRGVAIKEFLNNRDTVTDAPNKEVLAEGKILIDGFITGGNSTWYSVGTDSIKKVIEDQLQDDEISFIVLKIDSPGGSVSGINELSDFIYEAKTQKPIIAYSNGIIASGAYWIASACSEIYIDATAEVGSIGVVATVIDDEEFFSNLGIKVYEITNEDSPDKRLDFKEEKNREKVKKNVNEIAEIFYKKVARNRNLSVDKVKSDFGRGGMLVGQKAVDVGMVNRILNEGEIMKLFKKEEKEISVDVLKKEHPELVKKISAEVESVDRDKVLNIEHERQRQILSVLGISVPDCLFDQTEARDLAYEISTNIEAKEKYQQYLNSNLLAKKVLESEENSFVPPVIKDSFGVRVDREVKEAIERQKNKLGV